MGLKSTLTSLLLAAPLALAHPHPEGGREKVYQHAAYPRDERHLGSCKKRFAEDEFKATRAMRHGEEFLRLRREAGIESEDAYVFSGVLGMHERKTNRNFCRRTPLHKRDYLSFSKIDHKSSKTVSFNMDPSTLFADAGACMLMSEVDQGPLCK
jgi:hypothetical protein